MVLNVFMTRNLLAFFLFTYVLVCAEEEIAPYLSSECDALSLIDGVVNAHNGKFVQIDRDIEIRGSDPLDLTRYYDGGHQYRGVYGYSVGLGYPLELRFSPKDKKRNLCVDNHRLGAKIICSVTKSKGSKETWYSGGVDPDFFELGYINNCQAQLNGEPALCSMKVEGNLSYFDVYPGDVAKIPRAVTKQVAKQGQSNRFVPDVNATGPHSVFRKNPVTNRRRYESYRHQTNPQNPNKWESIKRFDPPGGVDDRHYNKALGKYIDTPHVHDPKAPGGVRYPEPWEIPP